MNRIEEPNQAYYPDDNEITEFYAGRATHAAEVFGCRWFAAAQDSQCAHAGEPESPPQGAQDSQCAHAGEPESPPQCAQDSQTAHGGGGAHRFCLWAPNARSVSVVGDFNDWDRNANPMTRYRGLWLCFVSGAKDGDNYKYSLECADGAFVLKADPYAAYAEIAPGTASKVWDVTGYEWGDAAWIAARETQNLLSAPVSIYELHLGSWRLEEGTEYPSYRAVANELCSYVKDMGFTHVELMPVSEYPFDGSWGYQVTGFFAVTSRFGSPQDFMYLVDTLHRAGIGVIVDWVPAHFPKDAHGLPRFDGTWLYEHQHKLRREHPQWGTYEFNYNRPEVVSFLVSSAVNLIERYHIDGLRVDAVSSMLYLDYGRGGEYIRNKDGGNIDYEAAAFIKKLNTAVLGDHPGVITAAEEATAYPLVTRPPYEGGLGFTFKWNMGFMHDTLDYMKSDPYFRHGAHDKLTFSMYYAFSENYILPYSHDEVVHGKASMIDKMFGDYAAKFAALKTLYGWLYGHPGKKLLFMGQEFAQFIEWDYKKSLDWFLLNYETHAGVRSWVRALNRLYRENSALYACEDSWDGFTWLDVWDRENNVFAFMRSDGEKNVVCVYNFSPVSFREYDIAMPLQGKLSLLLTSDERAYGGTGAKLKQSAVVRKKPLNGLLYSVTLAIPGACAIFYDYKTNPHPYHGDACHGDV